MSWRCPLHSIATAIPSLWGTLHQSSQKVLGTWYLMSQPNSFDPQGLCPPSVTFPHNFGKLFLKNTQKLVVRKSKASSFEQYSSFYFASPQTKPWSLMTPSLNKSTFSEWISLGCQTCPLPSWARLCNNSGIELLFVFILTMVFKVFSLNNSPCLWSFQVPYRFFTHPPYLSWCVTL